MTEMIDVSVLREMFTILDEAKAHFAPGSGTTFDLLRNYAVRHPDVAVGNEGKSVIDYVELEIFPERSKDE